MNFNLSYSPETDKWGFDLCDLDLWPWPFACTPILSMVMSKCYWPKQGKSEGFDSCDRPSNLKLDSNHKFFSPCDREIWWMTSENNRALLLYYIKLCASFQNHWWIQTGFTVQKRSIRVDIGDMLSRVTLKFDGWPLMENNRAPLLCYFKLCAAFHSHWWIQTRVTVRKCPIWVKFDDL